MELNHYDRVKEFMIGCGNLIPDQPTLPDEDTRKLRCRLLLEECVELINSLGFDIMVKEKYDEFGYSPLSSIEDVDLTLRECVVGLPDIAKEASDVSVIVQGTFISCGINPEPCLKAVDENNLLKIKTGYKDEHGKFRKAKDHPKTDMVGVLTEQMKKE